MSRSGPDTPLDRVLREIRAQRPPEARQVALPVRLRDEFRSFAAQPRSALRRTRTTPVAGWQLGIAAALVAAGTLLVLRPTEPERLGPAHTELRPPVPAVALVDGQPVETGVALVAVVVPRTVQHVGHASWVLLPGSRARLRSAGPVVWVDLEQGSLNAQVQPSEQPESFVVQARGTEVAVHGTRFSVSLQGERVQVEVTEGSVQVRPTGQSSGTLLRGHMRSDFVAGVLQPALAPHAEQAALPPQAGLEVKPARPLPPAGPGRAPSPAMRPALTGNLGTATPLQPPAATPPPDAESERALQAVTEHIRACFRRHLPGSSELGIEVSTRLGLWVEASGQLLRADFEPPLAPAIEGCVAEQLVQFRAAPSPEGYRVERDLVLQR